MTKDTRLYPRIHIRVPGKPGNEVMQIPVGSKLASMINIEHYDFQWKLYLHNNVAVACSYSVAYFDRIAVFEAPYR